MFSEPLTEMKVELVEDIATGERLIADEDELLIRVSKGMKRTHIEFEKDRQTRNPNRSNASYSLSKPIAIDSLQKFICDI
jgi:hypothetical protein